MEFGEVTMKVEQFHSLLKDATRWRVMALSNHLMLVDFDRRESVTMKSGKERCVDCLIKDDSQASDAGESK